MKKPTIAAISGFLLITASSVSADNLLQVYQQAKDNDPVFLASESGRMATNERVKQSKATLLPQIDLGASYGMSNSDSTTIFTDLAAGDPPVGSSNDRETDSTGWQVTLSQEVYNHASWLRLRQSEKRALQADINHDGSKQELIIRVSEAYFNVLSAKDDVAFSKAETEAVEKELAQTKQRFEVGLIAMTDVHEAQSRYDRAIANQIASQNALDNAHEALQQITGQYHYELMGLKQDIPLKNPEPENINQWVKEAEANNIAIKASIIGLEIAKKDIGISQAGHYPRLDLSASYSDGNSETESVGSQFASVPGFGASRSLTDSDTTSDSISLNFSVPIYSGGRTNSEVRESKNLYQQAAHNLEADHRQAVRDTRSSYLGVVAAVSSVRALGQAVVSAESALEATQAGFEVGTRTIVDVLLQTQQLFQAKREYARARYDYILNTLRLKQAAGNLTEQDLNLVNGLLR